MNAELLSTGILHMDMGRYLYVGKLAQEFLKHLIKKADPHWKRQFEYGQRSCFHQTKEDVGITITMGVMVQFLCGYVTLPLYALVTQVFNHFPSTEELQFLV